MKSPSVPRGHEPAALGVDSGPASQSASTSPRRDSTTATVPGRGRRNDDAVVLGLHRAQELGTRENGLAVAITTRADGSPRASVVNAGVLEHPVTGEAIVGFVSRGVARKLIDLRARPQMTVLFRSGWEWIAVQGSAELAGPDDHLEELSHDSVLPLVCAVYVAAVGGSSEDWAELDESIAAERHTAVLIRPLRVYPTGDPES